MKTEYWLFGGGAFFFVPLGFIYGFLSGFEPVGMVCLLLTGGLASLLGSYLWLTSRRIDERPEDDPLAEIADGAGDQGVFAPQSWWPLAIGLSIGVTFVGLTIGWWLIVLGGVLAMLSFVAFMFEFYRGAYAH